MQTKNNLYLNNGNIDPGQFKELQGLLWFAPGKEMLTPYEAFDLYEKLWAYVNTDQLEHHEKELITNLAHNVGNGVFTPCGGTPIYLDGVICD